MYSIIIILLIFVFYSIFITIKSFFLQKKLNVANLYNTNLSNLYDDVKGFKHDFQNMVFTIGGFINSNDIASLKNYYNSLLEECQTVNNSSILNPNIINNTGIYTLLNTKYNKAKEKNIAVNLECFIDFNKLHISSYELSRILGILLDNAIEAASISSEKKINISFRNSTAYHASIFLIENSYSNKDVDVTQIFEKGISSKKDHFGVGLWRVHKIVEANQNLKLITSKDKHYFKQQLEVY